MTPSDLFPEVFRRWDALHASWNQFLIASFGVLLLLLLVPRVRVHWRFVAAGYALFALGHLLTILHMLKQWRGVAEYLRDKLANPEWNQRWADAGIVDAPDPLWVVPHHLLIDAFVLVGLWRLGRTQPGSRFTSDASNSTPTSAPTETFSPP